MILLTGATGTVGRSLMPLLLERGESVRAFVREPKRLGRHRVDVQITIGNLIELRDPRVARQALRGVSTVIHLGATTRDEPGARVEEVNGLGTVRLLRSARDAGVERFLFFSALGATPHQRTRLFRAKALAERAVLEESSLATTVFAPSIIYSHDDHFTTLARRFSMLPVLPVSGRGEAVVEPLWADDAARCVEAWLDGRTGARRLELAGPEAMTYAELILAIARSFGRTRRVVRVPLGLVHASLKLARMLAGPAVAATWEEAELLEVPMVSEHGDRDVRSLGVDPMTVEAALRPH